MVDAVITVYRQLDPPQELQAYHDASLRAGEAFRDHARTRPSGDSFIEEFFGVALEVLGANLEIGTDTTKTDEEKERLIEERQQEILGEFFGPDSVAASQAADEVRDALPEETLALLDDAGCYSDITAVGEDQEETAQPGPTPTATADGTDDHGDSFEEATSIMVGEAVKGELASGGDIDYFRFRAEEGHYYRIELSEYSLADAYFSVGSQSDPESSPSDVRPEMVAVYDSEGRKLASMNDNLSSGAEWVSPDSGDNYVALGDHNHQGTYTLTVSSIPDDHGNSVSDATEITVGEPVNVKVDIQGDTDFLRFRAEAGQSYVIRVGLLFSYAPPSIALYGSDGAELESIDYESSQDGVVWEPSSPGDYYVVMGGPDGVGSYLLTVDHLVAFGDDHGDDKVRATNIEVGEAVAGNIGSEGDFDYFRFPATAGQSYRIDIALGTLIHAVASIYDSAGLKLARGDYLEGSDLIVWEAPTSWEYYIRVLGIL